MSQLDPLPTIAEIEESQRICEAATDELMGGRIPEDEERDTCIIGSTRCGFFARIVGRHNKAAEDDAAFWLHARQALPLRNRQLLAVLEALRDCQELLRYMVPSDAPSGKFRLVQERFKELGLKE